MAHRPRVVRLGIPTLIVAALALVALWRVGAPVTPSPADGGAARATGERPGPLTQIADLLTDNAVGRQASLEGVDVREVVSARTFWLGAGDAEPAFAVLDPDVKRTGDAPIVAGARVTLIGLVRPAPSADVAIRQWMLDAPTAQRVAEGGTYLHVTEVRPAAAP